MCLAGSQHLWRPWGGLGVEGAKPTCQPGGGGCRGPCAGGLLFPFPLLRGLVQCLVKSREGTLGGRKADGNLREPFGLILRAVARSPPLGSGIQSRLSCVPSAPLPPRLILAHWGAARGAQKPLVRGPCQLCWEAEKARLHGRVARWSHL